MKSNIYRHISSGSLYKFLLETNKGSTKPSFKHTAVYSSLATGSTYSRPMEEFLEKFENIPKVPYNSLKKGEIYLMPAEGSDCIAEGTPVRVLSIFTFNNTDTVFVTVEDTVNVTYNFKGEPEKIIVTFKWE